MPEFTTGISFIFIVQTLSQSAFAAVALLGLTWRRREISFPSQPGHWIALYLAVAWLYEIVLTVLLIFPVAQAFEWDSTIWLTTPMSWVFQCFAFALWAAAYLHESSRIWKLGWAAMTLKSLLAVLLMLFFIGAKCIEWLLEVFWYNINISWGFSFFSWGRYANFVSLLLPNYLLLAFLLAATVSDLRQQRRRHWSHWLVLISTFGSTAVATVYYHYHMGF